MLPVKLPLEDLPKTKAKSATVYASVHNLWANEMRQQNLGITLAQLKYLADHNL